MWTIHEVRNTVRISPELAREMFEAQAYEGECWYEVDEVAYDGRLQFNSDHNEHMDFLDSRFLEIMKRHRVQGDICFADLEQGGEEGSFWGYRFDGQGGLVSLAGEIVFRELNGPLRDENVVFTGKIPGMTRVQATEKVERQGGSVNGSVSRKTTILVAGGRPGQKLKKAEKFGVRVITPKVFLQLVEAGNE